MSDLLPDGPTLGGWCHIPGGFAAEVMGAAGFDWCLIDRQHGLIGEADGSKAAAQEAPFDAIVLSGSVAEVPESMLMRLKVGGRLIGIEGQEPVMRAVLITRMADRQFKRVELFDTVAPRLSGFGEPSRFAF